MARLSTHVLDISQGVPAVGIAVDLHHVRDGERRLIVSTSTNEDGRTPAPLMSGDLIEPGVYELTFHAGAYFRQTGIDLPAYPFLDTIVIRIGLENETGNYHVPLLLSPYGYSTYRGT